MSFNILWYSPYTHHDSTSLVATALSGWNHWQQWFFPVSSCSGHVTTPYLLGQVPPTWIWRLHKVWMCQWSFLLNHLERMVQEGTTTWFGTWFTDILYLHTYMTFVGQSQMPLPPSPHTHTCCRLVVLIQAGRIPIVCTCWNWYASYHFL